MSKEEREKLHWPSVLSMYFGLNALFALGSVAIREKSLSAAMHSLIAGSIVLLVVVCVFALLLLLLSTHMKAPVKVVGGVVAGTAMALVTKAWHLILGWMGAGLTSFALGVLLSASVHPSLTSIAAMFGPAALLIMPDKFFVVIILVGWSWGFAEMLRQPKVAVHKGGKGSFTSVAKNFQKSVGIDKEKAPRTAPEEGHFAEIEEPLSECVIRDENLAKSLPLVTAMLAKDWGKKNKCWLGLPEEECGFLAGPPGSGKGLTLVNPLLNYEKPGEGDLRTKFIVLSISPRDLTGPTVPWLRSQDMSVGIWDLTGSTRNTTRFGDPTYWSPVPTYDRNSKKNYDLCKMRVAEIIKGAQPEGEDKSYWTNQGISLMAPATCGASIRGASWETMFGWLFRWDDPTFYELDELLSAAGEDAALRDWRTVRAMKLRRKSGSDFEWEEKATTASDTGGSIATSLNGLLLDIATQSAYDATANPNLDPKEWIRNDDPAALFLIGNMREKGMTRSLLATLLHELLSEFLVYAMEHDDEKGPYRLVVLADELPNLAPLTDLEEYLSTGRKHRLQIIMATSITPPLEA